MSFQRFFFIVLGFMIVSIHGLAVLPPHGFAKSAILAGLLPTNRPYSPKWAYQADAPNARILAEYGNATRLEALEGMRLTTRGWCLHSRWGSLIWGAGPNGGADFDATAANSIDTLITVGEGMTSVAINCFDADPAPAPVASQFILLSVRPNSEVKFKMSVFRADRAVREFEEIENATVRPGDEVCIKDTEPGADSYRRFRAFHRLAGETAWSEVSTTAYVGTSPLNGFSCLSIGAGTLPAGHHQFRVVVEPFQNHLPKRANYHFAVKVIAPPSPSPSPSPTPRPTIVPSPSPSPSPRPSPTPTPTRTPSPTPKH